VLAKVQMPSLATVRSLERGGTPPALEALDGLSIITRYDAGDTVYHEHAPGNHCYLLVHGAARQCAIVSKGRRRIVEFLLPGDLFGFGVPFEHLYSVEVIVANTVIARYPRCSVEQLADRDPLVGRSILDRVLETLARLQWRMILLGNATALERVSAFLLEMAERSAADCRSDIMLPMSRYDIADYLGIAVESVSRALTTLRHRGAITLRASRCVHIVDRDALANPSCDLNDEYLKIAGEYVSVKSQADSASRLGRYATEIADLYHGH
jgi:CRP/FNR family transcriptional regulator, nitrogen fixation regulation protein